jgi:hypothetical protein
MNSIRVATFLGSGLLAAAALSAQAQDYSFSCITGNQAADCATGTAQFSLAVSDMGSMVNFTFSNAGPQPSSITDIYFDWTNAAYALTPGTISDSGAGVSFSWGSSPGDLPGGESIHFSADLAADSDKPTQTMGVNPGEWLNIAFTSDADLIQGLNSGYLRVGIHTQGYIGGGSESLVISPVPEPQTYAMLLAGLVLLGFEGRRRKKLLSLFQKRPLAF